MFEHLSVFIILCVHITVSCTPNNKNSISPMNIIHFFIISDVFILNSWFVFFWGKILDYVGLIFSLLLQMLNGQPVTMITMITEQNSSFTYKSEISLEAHQYCTIQCRTIQIDMWMKLPPVMKEGNARVSLSVIWMK